MAQVILFNYFATGSTLITLAIFIILHQTQPDGKRLELKEDLWSEKSNEIVEKSRREEISEEKNISSKKIEKKSMKKKIENLRLVRKEGFFTINPNKNQLKTERNLNKIKTYPPGKNEFK